MFTLLLKTSVSAEVVRKPRGSHRFTILAEDLDSGKSKGVSLDISSVHPVSVHPNLDSSGLGSSFPVRPFRFKRSGSSEFRFIRIPVCPLRQKSSLPKTCQLHLYAYGPSRPRTMSDGSVVVRKNVGNSNPKPKTLSPKSKT